MIHDELAAAGEEISQRLLSAGRIKDISLLDLLPGKSAACFSQLVSEAGEFLLLQQQFAPGFQPIRLRNDRMLFHGSSPYIGGMAGKEGIPSARRSQA